MGSIFRMCFHLGRRDMAPALVTDRKNSSECITSSNHKAATLRLSWLSDFHFHFQLRESFLYLLPSFTACCKEKAYFEISSVQSLSHVLLFATPWTAARQASLSITNFQNLLKLISIELVMPSNYLILCRPLLLPPSIFPSIRVFSNESVLHIRWPKYLEFQLQHHSFQWIFRTDFLYNWLVLSPFSPRDSQESSPTPQFKSINSSAFSFLYSPTLKSIHDYWKNHSFD